MKKIYCENCKQQVNPNDALNLCILIVLSCCFFPSAIVYFVWASSIKKCPICNLKIKNK